MLNHFDLTTNIAAHELAVDACIGVPTPALVYDALGLVGNLAFLIKCFPIEPGDGHIFTITFCGSDLIELVALMTCLVLGSEQILPLPCMGKCLAGSCLLSIDASNLLPTENVV